MRILFVASPPLDRSFGGAKPFLELADEFEERGWGVERVSLSEEVPGDSTGMRSARAEYLRSLLAARAAEFDVVDFDHEYLPYARSGFPESTLLVARSVLLCQQVAAASFPRPWSLRKAAGGLLVGRKRRADLDEMLLFASRSIHEADLINLSNHDDADVLVRAGVSPEKIVVLPFGLSSERRARLMSMRPERPHAGVVAFVGTFDWRKGGADMPAIVEQVIRAVPGTRFRFLGTKGIFVTKEEVVRQFPTAVRPFLEVVPSFAVEDLPALLEDCTLGFFPSYLEGFPFAVLEMLATSLPVVAYSVPGPRMMLAAESLVPAGGSDEIAARIIALLRDPQRLSEARIDAQRRAAGFRWEQIAARTAEVYEERLRSIRSGSALTASAPRRDHQLVSRNA